MNGNDIVESITGLANALNEFGKTKDANFGFVVGTIATSVIFVIGALAVRKDI